MRHAGVADRQIDRVPSSGCRCENNAQQNSHLKREVYMHSRSGSGKMRWSSTDRQTNSRQPEFIFSPTVWQPSSSPRCHCAADVLY